MATVASSGILFHVVLIAVIITVIVIMVLKKKKKTVASAETTKNNAASRPAAAAPETSVPVQNTVSDPVTVLMVYLDIDKLDSGVYGLAAGRAVARAVPASMLEGMIIFSGDSNETLYGSANEYVIGIKGRASSLRAVEKQLRADASLGAFLSSSGIRMGGNEPLVIDGTVTDGALVDPPGHSTSFCGVGFNDAWKKAQDS